MRSVPSSASNSSGPIWPADDAHLAMAAEALARGDLIGLPTETVYGLAADATSNTAVAKIYAAKGRPRFNPLISHVADMRAAEAHGDFTTEARRFAAAFWPGPLTLVVPARDNCRISDLARAGLDTVALRVPDHAVAQALLRRFEGPVAAPSANRSGRISPTATADVVIELGNSIAGVLDGGACTIGVESTVVACLPGHVAILRPGGVTRERIEQVLGWPPEVTRDADQHRGPGMLASHYAPDASVRLNASDVRPGEALLNFGAQAIMGAGQASAIVDLSPTADLHEAACRLFSALRELDAHAPQAIAVAPIPERGLGEAINDRLRRAAAPRP